MALQDDWWIGPELLIDIIFIADIILNFQTGYIYEQVSHAESSENLQGSASVAAIAIALQHLEKIEKIIQTNQ